MRARLFGLLTALGLVSCAAITALVAEKPPEPLQLPVPTPPGDITMRVFVIGDPGEATPVHDAAFNAMAGVLAEGGSVPAALLIPGDVVYPSGLPGTCEESLETLKADYLKRVPGSVRIFAVPGNSDHGAKPMGIDDDAAWRLAYFDCDQQANAADAIGWIPRACPCDPRWHVPTGAGHIGVRPLLPASSNHKGFTLVAYDSQAAIDEPELIAKDLERVLDSAAPTQRIIVMANHPIMSVGPHGRGSGLQDLGGDKYKAYIDRFSLIFATRADRVALTIFGHDNSLQYFPRGPPILISGAGAHRNSASTPPDGAFAVGGQPGIAVLDLHAGGGVTVHLISDEEPKEFEISAVE